VLKAPDVPSALVELGFLSNAEDRRRLADPAWQQLALSALTKGLVDWYDTVRG
jgi:N-acetylmuramoyl-L-alanine amidase